MSTTKIPTSGAKKVTATSTKKASTKPRKPRKIKDNGSTPGVAKTAEYRETSFGLDHISRTSLDDNKAFVESRRSLGRGGSNG